MADVPARAPGELLRQVQEEGGRGEISRERLGELARLHRTTPALVVSLYTFYFPRGAEKGTRVCTGLPCALRGTQEALNRLEASGHAFDSVPCLGYCARAPVLYKDGAYYSLGHGGFQEIEESRREFVEANTQRLADYRSEGGYSALVRFLEEKDRTFLLDVLANASLRGMGGAGFSVERKWKAVLASGGTERHLLVNAHEGEPGTFKDRLILEREPHRLLEGSLIAALTVGAQAAVIALRR